MQQNNTVLTHRAVLIIRLQLQIIVAADEVQLVGYLP